MPILKNKNSLTQTVKRHFSYHEGRYFNGGVAVVLAGALWGSYMGVSTLIEKAGAHQKEAALAQEKSDKAVREALRAAYERGDTSITYAAGDTYRILAKRGFNGDTVVTAHRATGLAPNGDITAIETAPAIVVHIPAAPQPAAPSGPK